MGARKAFDSADAQIMQTLADFAAMAVRHIRQQRELMTQATASAAASMANDLAHQINNPLQGLTNVLYLAAEGESDSRQLAREASADLSRLSLLVKRLLALPAASARVN